MKITADVLAQIAAVDDEARKMTDELIALQTDPATRTMNQFQIAAACGLVITQYSPAAQATYWIASMDSLIKQLAGMAPMPTVGIGRQENAVPPATAGVAQAMREAARQARTPGHRVRHLPATQTSHTAGATDKKEG